jgi:hypothetical protein
MNSIASFDILGGLKPSFDFAMTIQRNPVGLKPLTGTLTMIRVRVAYISFVEIARI